jgi:exosortase
LPLKPAWSGLVIFLFALLTLIVGVISREFFLPRISLLLLISGVVVFWAGWKYLAAVAFPLAFLILMLPSSTLFSPITLPLQIVSTKVATLLLMLTGVPAVREGNIILLQTARLGVTEACSGIRFLFSLITLAIIYGYLAESKIGVRVSLVLSAVPISILANALRVAGTGFVVQHWGIERAEGTLHLLSGWLIFLGALVMFFAFHRLIRMLCPGKRDCEKQQECA